MKLIDYNNERSTKRVIMYNHNQTKALYHNKQLMHIEGNLYIGEFEYDCNGPYCDAFAIWPEIDVGIWLGSVSGKWEDETDVLSSMERTGYDTLENFKRMVNTKLENSQHFRFTEIEMMKLVDASMVDAMWESRKRFAENRKLKEEARRKEQAEKEAALLAERKKEAEEIINEALETLRHGGELANKSVTIYRSECDYSTYSIVNYLLREYGVKAPIKTQGWINNSLVSITIQDGKCEHCRYYKHKNGRGSTTVFGYINELIEAVNADGKLGQEDFQEVAG